MILASYTVNLRVDEDLTGAELDDVCDVVDAWWENPHSGTTDRDLSSK